MHGPPIAGAIAAVAADIQDALIGGRPTTKLRRQLAELEARERAEARAAGAEERARREAAAAVAEAAIAARAFELAEGAKARLGQRLTSLEPPSPPVVRRAPAAVHHVEDQP